MQQHLMQMQPMMAAYYSNSNFTTDHIQQYLDENKALILKIVESQNSGKINECAENQARLQRNLMYLASIADSQPQATPMHSQYANTSAMQAGTHYTQHQQHQTITPQALMAARSSLLYSQQHQQPYAALQQHQHQHQHQHQQSLEAQMGMGSMGGPGGVHVLQGEHDTSAGYSDFGLASTGKQDVGSTGSAEARGEGSENMYLKTLDDSN